VEENTPTTYVSAARAEFIFCICPCLDDEKFTALSVLKFFEHWERYCKIVPNFNIFMLRSYAECSQPRGMI
jgi:hypothetical protein